MNSISDIPLPGLAEAAATLADARRYVLACETISDSARRNHLSQLSGIESVCGLPAAAVELTCPNLRRLLYRKQPMASGFTAQRFGKLVGSLRFAMRGLGLHAPKPSRDRLDPMWRPLFEALPDYRQVALSGAVGFFSDSGFRPDDFPADALELFETFITDFTLEPDPAGLARRTASNGNWARANTSGWSNLPELRRPRMREHYTPSLESCPPSLRDDARRWLDGLACIDHEEIYHDDVPARTGRRRRRAARPRTLQTREYQLRQAIAALTLQGVPVEEIHTLRDLVAPIEHASLIRRFFLARHGDEPNSQVAGILEVLRQIAKYHCKLPARDVAVIAGWVSDARPDWKDGMTEKNRRRLRALIQLRPRAMLLNFPRELLRRAEDGLKAAACPGAKTKTLTPKAAARLVAYAVALEIELVFPMRRENLAGLHLDQHLQRLGPRGRRVTHIFLSKSEMKNRHGMEWELPKESCDLIETFAQVHRPHIAHPANRFLFPGPGLEHRSAHELALGLCELIGRELGLELNIHLLRHFAGWVYLKNHPGEYEVLRQALGHKSLEVTKACYTGLEDDASARHFDDNVLLERAATRDVAAAAFRRPTRKTAKRKTAKRGARK